MRLLIATHQWFPDYASGSARVATDTARRLAARGHEVLVLAPETPGAPSEERAGGLTLRRALGRGALPQTLTDALATFGHARRLRRGDFDVLVAHHPTTAVGLLGARLGAPLVFVYHASVVRELRLERASLGGGRRRLATYGLAPMLAAMERRAVAGASRCLTLSHYSASLLGRDHRGAQSRIRVASGGVDPKAFAPAPDREALRRRLGLPDAPLILTARRLDSALGLETVICATAALEGPRPPLLAIAGEGPLEGSLRRLAAELGIADRVRFLGVAPPGALHDHYRVADLFVISPAPHEGFGMVTLEALASGTPVVGGPRGATPELLRPLDPRLVADEPSPESLAAAMGEALGRGGPDLRRRCRDYVLESYDWASRIEGWEAVLAEAAGQARPPRPGRSRPRSVEPIGRRGPAGTRRAATFDRRVPNLQPRSAP